MLTAETVRQLLDYDPATGEFTWKAKPVHTRWHKAWNSRFAGKRAGRTKPNMLGYLEIAIDSVLYPSARLAWIHVTGNLPEANIDHKDTVKTNNRWDNLREATVAQNGWNAGRKSDNRSGYKGVALCRPTGRYYSQICANGVRHHLGHFATAKEAHDAYVEAAKRLHGEFARAA